MGGTQIEQTRWGSPCVLLWPTAATKRQAGATLSLVGEEVASLLPNTYCRPSLERNNERAVCSFSWPQDDLRGYTAAAVALPVVAIH